MDVEVATKNCRVFKINIFELGKEIVPPYRVHSCIRKGSITRNYYDRVIVTHEYIYGASFDLTVMVVFHTTITGAAGSEYFF